MKALLIMFCALLTACGQPVCVVGLGNCDTQFKGTGTGTETQTGSDLALISSSPTVAMGNILILTITGGTGPYTCSLVDNSKGTIELVETNKCKYTAPTSTGTAIARVTDSKKDTADLGIIIE